MIEDPSIGDPFVAVEKRIEWAASTGKIKDEENVLLKEYAALLAPIVKMPATDIELVFNSFPRKGGFVQLADVIGTTQGKLDMPS